MPYNLTTETLNQYLCERVNTLPSGQTHKLISASLSPDEKSLILKDHKDNTLIVIPSLVIVKSGNDRIEMVIEPHHAGVNESDVEGFLEKMIDKDQIFGEGQPLSRHPIHSDTLKRESHKGNRMICSIIDKRAGTGRVRIAIYDYMFRGVLFYALRGVGQYSAKQ